MDFTNTVTAIASKFYNTTVTSPNYPSDYDNNLECTLLIKVDNSLLRLGYIVKVIFNDFQLQSSCDGDVLKFYDGMNVVSINLLGSYCGTTHPEVIYSTGQYLYVKFRTDSILAYKGFSFSFSAVKEGTLQFILTTTVISYPAHECLCQSLIRTPKHHRPRCSYYLLLFTVVLIEDSLWENLSFIVASTRKLKFPCHLFHRWFLTLISTEVIFLLLLLLIFFLIFFF